MPRLPYLDRDDLDEEHRAHFDGLRLADGRMMNLHRMLAYRPRSMQARVALARTLAHVDPLVDPRLRELAILTVGRLTRCAYEFHHHISRGTRAGLSAEHVMALPVWERHPLFTDEERAVIRYAEEMTRDVQVRDETFERLRAYLAPAQIVELTLAISHYNATVRVLEALQVLPDEEGGA